MHNNNKEYLKKKLYLIVPIICITFYNLFFLINDNFILSAYDFEILYDSGKVILSDPKKLYTTYWTRQFTYLPSFATFFAFTFSLIPLIVSEYLFYIFNFFLAILFVREFDKILILMNVKENKFRFLFLIIISNGWIVYHAIFLNQSKFLVGVLLFFILRRELQYRKFEKKKDLKYYFINYTLFLFIVGIVPYFIFLLLIYLFDDIHLDNFFNKLNVEKYLFILMMFVLQNFLFVLYPLIIFNYIQIVTYWVSFSAPFYLIELGIQFNLDLSLIFIILNIIFYIIVLILILNNKLQIEKKFAYFSLFFILLHYLAARILLILLPYTILIFVPFLIQDKKGKEFIKSNKVILLSMCAIFGIYFSFPNQIILNYFPIFNVSFFLILFCFRWIFLLGIIVSCIIVLNFKNYKIFKNQLE